MRSLILLAAAVAVAFAQAPLDDDRLRPVAAPSRDAQPYYGQQQRLPIRQQDPAIITGSAASGAAPSFCVDKENRAFSNGCSSSYRWCWEGVETAHTCPEGLYFDGERGACDMRMNVFECSGRRVTFPQNTPAETVDFACPADGLFSGNDQRQCISEFLHCSNGIAYKKTCDQGLAFDPDEQVCARPEHILACGGNPEELAPPEVEFDCPAPTGLFPHPSVLCNRVHFECQDNVPERKFCAEDELFDENARQCRRAADVPDCDFDCATRETGVYSVGCSQDYWWCWDHRATKHRCPQGFFFNAENGQCGRFVGVFECSGRRVTPTTQATPLKPVDFDCFGLEDGDYPLGQANGYTCIKDFAKCANGRAFAFECPAGLDFDPVERFCQPKANILACGGVAPTQLAEEKPSFVCPAPTGTFAHPTHLCSATYFECQNNEAQTRICSKGQVFDEARGACQQQDQVQGCAFDCASRSNGVYSEGCSNSYWACWGGAPTKLACPHRLFFDQERGLCDVRATVYECTGMRFTPTIVRAGPKPETVDFDCAAAGEGDHAIPGAGCTADFVKCAHNTPYKFSCPDQLRFDPTTNECVSAARIAACARQQSPPSGGVGYSPGQPAVVKTTPAVRVVTTTEAAPIAPIATTSRPTPVVIATTEAALRAPRTYAPFRPFRRAVVATTEAAPIAPIVPIATTQAPTPAPITRATPAGPRTYAFRPFRPAAAATTLAPIAVRRVIRPTTTAAPAAPVATFRPTFTRSHVTAEPAAAAATTERSPFRGFRFPSAVQRQAAPVAATTSAPVANNIPPRRRVFRPVNFRGGYNAQQFQRA